MIEAFHLGGWGMYPTAIAGTVLVLAAAHYAWRPARLSLHSRRWPYLPPLLRSKCIRCDTVSLRTAATL